MLCCVNWPVFTDVANDSMLSYSESSSHRSVLGLLLLEDEGYTILRNVSNYSTCRRGLNAEGLDSSTHCRRLDNGCR
jgi:hypothetical protein